MPEQPTMSVGEFAAKWSSAEGGESSLSQSQFNDLCAVLGTQTPSEADEAGSGADYAFEKRVPTGSADVWKRGCFGWEYKSPGSNLVPAYQQLLGYREGLENPPLLIVSDMKKFEIHTNFTNAPVRVIKFSLKDLRDNPGYYVRILRDAFHDPEALHPNRDPRYITEIAARKVGEVASALRERDGLDPALVARFLIRLIFCTFAGSVDLFRVEGPKPSQAPATAERPVRDLLRYLRREPDDARDSIMRLFAAMASERSRTWGVVPVPWFNGGLFDDAAAREVPLLTSDLLQLLHDAAELDWSVIDPAIMGTLFERGLDPEQRTELGAYFTDAASIAKVVEPVILQPLRAEFAALQRECSELLRTGEVAEEITPYNGNLQLDRAEDTPAQAAARAFHDRLANLRVLDPACGSGNFLYVAMRELKELEHEFIEWAVANLNLQGANRRTGPDNMLGIDINPFAVELTRASLWIGDIQWVKSRTNDYARKPILGNTDQIECRDALLEHDPFGNLLPEPAEWPEAEFIIGNPPFLGSIRMKQELGEKYVGLLHECWGKSVPGGADLSIYWHEQARRQIERRKAKRAGLLTTQNVRGALTRPVLQRICDTGAIFLAYSDEPWIGDGAAVRIAIVGQDNGAEEDCQLDGHSVEHVNPDLTTGPYLASAKVIASSRGVAFMGGKRNGPFDIDSDVADAMIKSSGNPNGRPNSDIVVPFITASDLAGIDRHRYIIDFIGCSEDEAADYAAPFEYVLQVVKPVRDKNPNDHLREQWWLHAQPALSLRNAIADLPRWIVTPVTSKHRFFVWRDISTVHDNTTVVIARADDYAFGVLSSKPHTLWALATGTRIGQGNDPRYVHGSTFNTFPFPWPLDTLEDALDDGQREHHAAISEAAKDLDDARARWLGADSGRTMTELYNEKPTWFDNRQQALDEAVLDAYGWPHDISDDEILERLLALNLARAAERD